MARKPTYQAALDEYFNLLYGLAEQGRKDGLDKYGILHLLGVDNNDLCSASRKQQINLRLLSRI